MATPTGKQDRVWFVTGASSGFGRELSKAVLARGERLVATSRNPEAVDALVEAHAERALALPLDVTDAAAAREAVSKALARFGRLDVAVNNAGYGHVGAVEELTDEELRRQLEVNLFGVINVTRAVLPSMRAQRSGHLVQMSSLNGLEPLPGAAYYTASKFGIEGFSETLAAEVAPLGIKVTIVEPGPFRTRFLKAAKWAKPMPDYAQSVGKTREMLHKMDGKQPGDPARAAHAILQAVDAEKPPLHLPLGSLSFDHIRKVLATQLQALAAAAPIGIGADFPGTQAAGGDAELVRKAYSAFNERNVEAGVALMDPEVDWPNVPAGGFVHGRAQLREHWREQFRQVDPRIEVAAIAEKGGGRVEAQVRQIVRAPDGSKLSDDRLVHVFTIAGERIKRMEVLHS